LIEIRQLAEANQFTRAATHGRYLPLDTSAAYIEHLLTYISPEALPPLRIVVDAGNGGAGRVVDLLAAHLPFEFIRLNHEPDGHFPNGVPNPLLQENRAVTSAAVLAHGADLGLAWDGDFDRCFFFDERGEFVEGYYLVGLLAEMALDQHPGGTIIHDPRLIWNTIDRVSQLGGRAVESKTGHAFIKERMRAENAVYGGEMSAHHYFRDFAFCDSGMIPWLLVAAQLGRRGLSLSALMAEGMAAFPCSGEINRSVADPAAVLAKVAAQFRPGALSESSVDGLSLAFADWRFNLRLSNTEPVVRLNVESRGDAALMAARTAELLALIDG
jgi:phosphomannomutase